MLMSGEFLRGILFTLLFTLVLAGNMALGSPRNSDRWGDYFPLEEKIFTFDKVI